MSQSTKKEITFKVDFELGDIVFLRTCSDRECGMVTVLQLTGDGGIIYGIAWGNDSYSTHYAMELSAEYVPSNWQT